MIGQLDIYRAGAIFATVDIDDKTVFFDKLPGTEYIECPIKSLKKVDFQKGDYTIHKGVNYKINLIPEFGKASSTKAKTYKINFEAPFYDLLKMFVENNQGAHIFPYYANARDHAQLICDNANRTESGWVLGDIEDTPAVLINYDWLYVRPSLDTIAEATGLEWKVTGKTIHFVKSVGRDTSLVFEYGRGKGLHEITRSADTTKSVANKIYGVGGIKNITSKYRGGTEPNLVFEERYVTTAGVIAGTERAEEGKYKNEEIYPRFEGTVTATTLIRDSSNKITGATITDTSIDFDIMLHLQEGVKPTVSFRTGPLAGVEGDFEISNFDFATKTATLVINKDANGYELPNDLNFPEVGHKFTFLNLNMPPEYVAKAELELKTASELYRDQNKLQRLNYTVTLDEKQLRDNNIQLRAGDRANMIDVDLNVDEILRFTEISYPLVNEFKVSATIGNEITYDREVKLYKDVLNNTQQMAVIDRRGQEIAKRNAQNLRVLAESIFDVEGNFDSAKFNVGVLSALLGIFGIQSANFLLNKVFITGNYGSDPNAVNISAGELFHLEYSNAGNQNIWQMQPVTQSGLTPGQGYYVYSKLSKTSQVGSFLITTDQIKPDDIPGFYTVRTGFIYPQIDGWRDVDFTYGITTVNGRQIKTGEIRGNTNALILNLDTGEIFGRLTFRGSDGTVKDVVTVDNKAALAQANALAAQVLADNAAAQAQSALTELAAIANDGVLDVSEKTTLKKDRIVVNGEVAKVQSEASKYNISLTAYNAALTNLGYYLDNIWLINNGENTPVDRTVFNTIWGEYYSARDAVYTGASNAARDLIDNINVGGRNFFKRTTPLTGSEGLINVSHQNLPTTGYDQLGILNGIYAVGSNGFENGSLRISNVITHNGEWTVSGYIKSNGPRDFHIDICDNNTATGLINYTSTGQYQYFEYTYNVQNYSANVYNFVDFSNISWQHFQIQDLKVEEGNRATGWSAAPEDTQADLDLAIAKGYASGKMIYRDPEFANGFNGISVYNNVGNGAVGIARRPNSDLGNTVPNASGFFIRIIPSVNASPYYGGFTFGTLTRPNAVFIVRILAALSAGQVLNWQSNSIGDGGSFKWNTSNTSVGGWQEFIGTVKCGSTGSFNSTNYFAISGGVSEIYIASATVYDMTAAEIDYLSDAQAKANAALASANAFADSIAASKAAIAQANAISAASSDAQTKANTAYSTAVAASNTYASTAANNASSAAQIAAAADASNKATTAYNNAVAAATVQYNTLTGSLKSLAYQDLVELSKLGNTIIENGLIKTVLLDANAIRSNIINVGYIQGLNASFTQGTIGGWAITGSNLQGSNGGTSIELNVTAAQPFIQVVAGATSTRIDYQGMRTTFTVTDDIKILRAMFINADHVFIKTGIDSNGNDQYGGRVNQYDSNGFALIERNGANVAVNAYDVTASHFMTGNNVRYNTLTNLSDIRYKKYVQPLSYGLKEIESLNPISFKYKVDTGQQFRPDDIRHLGLSAQEVQTIMPELVMDGDQLTISMIEIVPVLINAIKELKQQVDNLK
jgi:hypothetical protein